MKPDSLLGGYANKISVSQAKSMGYYIPDNYKESTVPKINFDTVDRACCRYLFLCVPHNISGITQSNFSSACPSEIWIEANYHP